MTPDDLHAPSVPVPTHILDYISKNEMYAHIDARAPEIVNIYNEDGEFLFRVSRQINSMDLHAVFTYGNRMRVMGESRGQEKVAYQIRSILGLEKVDIDE